MAARPHPRAALRPDSIEEEDAADVDAILQHVVVVLVPADWRAFEDLIPPNGGCLGCAGCQYSIPMDWLNLLSELSGYLMLGLVCGIIAFAMFVGKDD
jgi:hypothetical protein